MEQILDKLGLKHGTDKSSRSHRYLDFYEIFFREFLDQPIKFLEIGVAGGASLRTWRDFFPLGQIIGMDIEEKNIKEERITTVQGDQSREEDLLEVSKLGPFDIINDDAGHNSDHQLYCMKYLLPYLAPGGLYVLEDIMSDNVVNFLCEFTKLIELRNTSPEIRLFNYLEWIAFKEQTCIIKVTTPVLHVPDKIISTPASAPPIRSSKKIFPSKIQPPTLTHKPITALRIEPPKPTRTSRIVIEGPNPSHPFTHKARPIVS